MLVELALEYFDAFGSADLVRLRRCFASNVHLRDWNVEIRGIESVLAENANILRELGSVNFQFVGLYEVGHTVVAEMIISVSGASPIKVVDVLDFNQEKKIVSLRAYKG